MSIKISNKINLVIFSLFLVIGFVIYYVYMKPEHFYGETDIPDNCPTQPPQPYNSIISKYSGIGINIKSVTPDIGNISSEEQLYQIQSIPVYQTDILGGVYAVSDDNTLTIVVQNKNDINQLWTLNEITDSQNNKVYIVKPYLQKVSGIEFALQYENGTLSYRPFDSNFQGQHWIPSTSTFNKGIPILSYNPLSIYTAEFNPNASVSGNSNVNSLDNQNNKQVTDVLNLVKQGVQQYMSQLSTSTNNTGNISSSSIGNESNPLNINLNIAKNNTELFTDVTNTPTPTSSVVDLLNKYEAATTPFDTSDYTLYKLSDLEASLKNTTSRYSSSLNPDEYVYKTIGSCNCQL